MPHVITQSCCSDGSCVYACPVNCIHPSPDEPGFATAEMLYIDPVACVDCGACVERVPGRGHRARHQAGAQAAAVHRAERGVLSQARDQTAADVQAGAGDRGAVRRGPFRRPADGGDRRLGAGRDVRRRRTAHPAWRAGQRLRKAADTVRAGARGRRARPPEHQAGDDAVRHDRQAARVSVLPQRRGGIGPDSRRAARAPSRGALRGRRAQRPQARHRGHGPAGHRHRHRDGGLDQRPSRIHRLSQSIWTTNGWSSSATATSPSTSRAS